jgi:O-antigen/teichoic acid export membrane protein
VITLITGTGLAQAIPIAISPILTRLYTPEEFGMFGMYLAIVSIFAVAATGRYELAILLPRNDKDAMNIVALSASLSVLFSLFLLIVVVVFGENITLLFGEPSLSAWLFWVPLSVLLVGVYQSLNYWSNRKGYYKRLAVSRTLQSVGASTTQVSAGYLNVGALGLIAGQVVAQIVSSSILAHQITKGDNKTLKQVSKKRMCVLAKKYNNFPKFLIAAHGFNTGSSQMPIMLLTAFFNSSVAGFYMLTQRVMGAPTTLIAGAIGDVFRQEASQAYRTTGNCRKTYTNTLKKLLLLSILPSVIFFFIAPGLFALIFGESWREAGVYAQILTPVFFLRFVTSPLSAMFMIAEKQKLDLVWQIGLFFLTVVSLVIGYHSDSVYLAISLFSASYSFMFLLNVVMTFKMTISSIKAFV